MAKYKQGLAFGYVQGTKYHRNRPVMDDLGSIPSPSSFKNYPDVERIQLPEPDLAQSADLWQCLAGRRSERNTTPDPLSLDELAIATGAMTLRRPNDNMFLIRDQSTTTETEEVTRSEPAIAPTVR